MGKIEMKSRIWIEFIFVCIMSICFMIAQTEALGSIYNSIVRPYVAVFFLIFSPLYLLVRKQWEDSI